MKYVIRLFALLFGALLIGSIVPPAEAQDAPFITVWDTENSGDTDDDQIKIPGTGTDYQIIWEELGNTSNTDTLTATDVVTVNFPNPGLYRIKISGDFTRIHFGNRDSGGDADKIVRVSQWGNIQWQTMEEAFENTSSIELAADDTPDLSGVESTGNMFEASLVEGSTSSIGSWDVSSVTDMAAMFRDASNFNQDIGSWDVSSVTDMAYMFSEATSFNQYIGGWDVSSVNDMSFMFLRVENFDQDISEWDVSSVTDMSFMFNGAYNFNQPLGSWDVSSVTNMEGMFRSAGNFNQDISEWDVSSVTNMGGMFKDADSFDQDIGDWDVSNVTNMDGMFFAKSVSTENYDRILVGWAVQDLTDGQEPEFRSSYCDAGPFRTHLTEEFGWTVGDFQNSGCPDTLTESQARQIDGDGTFEFGDVATMMTFAEVVGSGRVTLARYDDAPRNVSQGTPEPFRLVIAGGGITFFEEVELRFDVDQFDGLDQPSETLVFNRPQPGTGSFSQLPTTFDQEEGELVATTENLGEIAFAHEDSTLASRLISVAPQSLELGIVPIRDTAMASVTVASEGNGVLEGTVGLQAEESPFSIDEGAGEFSLSAGDSLRVTIAFSPAEVSNPDRDTLQITHTGDSTASPIKVPLQGLGKDSPTVVQFENPTNVTALSASFSGTVNPERSTTTATFEYREVGASSFESITADENPLTGTSDQSVSGTATGLAPDSEYEAHLIATNDVGADTSALKSFSTEAVGIEITGGGADGFNRTFEATPGGSSQAVGAFRLTPDTTGVVLDSLSVTAESSSNVSGVTQVAFWASENDALETSDDIQLASRDVSGESGFPSEIEAGGLAYSLSTQEQYYFVTVSLSSDGQGQVTGLLSSESAIGLEGGEINRVNGSEQSEFTSLPLSSEDAPLPVEIADFKGASIQGDESVVRITWQTASETNNAGFEVQRKEESGWNQMGFVDSKAQGGSTTETQSYRYTAEDLPVGTHQFRLKQVDLDGSSQVHGPVSVDVQMQEALKLTAPAPNPVSSTATLSFAVKEQAEATVAVYDMLGRRVTTLYDGTPAPGQQQRVQMDASTLPSGAYLLRLRAAGRTETQRVTVLR